MPPLKTNVLRDVMYCRTQSPVDSSLRLCISLRLCVKLLYVIGSALYVSPSRPAWFLEAYPHYTNVPCRFSFSQFPIKLNQILSSRTSMVPVSILDLVPVILGETPREALRKSLDLAQHAETFGYKRYWVAEHHNMTGIASAATSIVIGFLAGGTSTIRVGSGGIMLPNHPPLVIAEQFGTLESLYPGRIDLGLGRAPGTDHRTLRALRRAVSRSDDFPEDVLELMLLLADSKPGQPVRAVPGAGTNVPIWILGSSTFGA